MVLEAAARGWEAPVLVLVLAEAEKQAQALVEAGAEANAETQTEVHPATYSDVLADPKLEKIIYSMGQHHHELARDLWRHSQHWWFIQIIAPITRLPREVLHQILLIIIDNASDSPLVLLQVCKHWYNIVTNIWASLNLGTTTPRSAVTRKLERSRWRLDVVVDTESDRGDFTPPEGAYQAIFAAIQAASRWRSLVVETFPSQIDLPELLVNSGLQQCSGAVMSRLGTFRIKCSCEMSPLLERLLRILGTTASRELTKIQINSANVISFLLPTYSSIFRSVTVLSLDAPGLPNPVDLLPHLHQLESLTASHLPLPVYHNGANLPFVHTLRHLKLRCVSIQWMSGRTFHALETCVLIFPLHRHVLHTFCTTLPNCKHLSFEGHPLDILEGVSARNLPHLSVMSSCSYNPRGSRQLVRFSSHALRQNRLMPRFLHISIEATTQAWTKALAFMSNLEELVIHGARPSSLGVKVLQSLVVHPVQAGNIGTTSAPVGRNPPACPLLKQFGIRYRRWLRPTEDFDLIPEFMSIIRSRQQSKCSLQSFRIWRSSNQKDPLDLIEGSRISLKGFERLANVSAMKGGNLLELVASRLLEVSGKSSTTCSKCSHDKFAEQ